jgi:hypothetical protein
MTTTARLRWLFWAGLAAGASACGPSEEEWQAKLGEVDDLHAQL